MLGSGSWVGPYRWVVAADLPSVHDQIAQGLRGHPAKKGMRFNVLVTLVEIGGSIALLHLAEWLAG
jgi:hypothetical protein